MKYLKRILPILAVFILALSSLSVVTIAQQGNSTNGELSGQGLEITPPLLELHADPGETVTVEIGVRNITSMDVIASGTVNDFVAKDESGQPKILLASDEESPYPLAAYIPEVSDLRIAPTEQEVVEIQIHIPKDASPGGHFGVVRFSARPADPSSDSSGLAISASIGTLILLSVSGEVKEALAVAEMFAMQNGKPGAFFETGPFTFVARLENTGNVHSQPAGQLLLTNIFGKEVAAIDFNDDERNILPRSIRRFEHVFEDKEFWFGRYTLTADLRYGADNSFLTASTGFWVIPYRLLAIALLMLVMIFFFGRKALKSYNHHVVRKYQQSGGDSLQQELPPEDSP